MKFQIDPNLLRKEDEVSIYDSKFGLAVGAGNAVNREEMVLIMPVLKDLDFKVTEPHEGWVQVWLKKADFDILIDVERKTDSRISNRNFLVTTAKVAYKLILQAVISGAMIAFAAVGVDAVFQFEAVVNFWVVFAWTAPIVFVLGALIVFLSLLTGKSL